MSDERRTARLAVRVTPEELTQFAAWAREEGLSMADWLRAVAMQRGRQLDRAAPRDLARKLPGRRGRGGEGQ